MPSQARLHRKCDDCARRICGLLIASALSPYQEDILAARVAETALKCMTTNELTIDLC